MQIALKPKSERITLTLELLEYAKKYFHDDFGNFLTMLAHFHLSLNRVLLYQSGYKLPSVYLIGPIMTGKTSLTTMAKSVCPHKLIEDDSKLVIVEECDKTLAVLSDSVTEERETLILDPVKWSKKEDRINHANFEDDLYENKITMTKAKATKNVNVTPLTGIAYIFPGDFGHQIPHLSETLLTKSIWCQQTKRDLSSQDIIAMKKIYKEVTNQHGKCEARYSCIFQDLICQIDMSKFNGNVKSFYEDLLNSHEGSGVNVSRFLENYAVLLAALTNLLETIGLEKDTVDELVDELQKTVEEKFIPFTLGELSKISTEKVQTPSGTKKEDVLDFVCDLVTSEEIRNITPWITFDDKVGYIYFYAEFIKKRFTKEEFLRAMANGMGEEKSRIKFKSSKSKDFDWFYDTTTIGMSYGSCSRFTAYKIKLGNCPDKFQRAILDKLNEKLGGERPLTASSDIKSELDKFYANEYCVIEGDDERKNGRKMLNNLTPKRFKRVYDLMVQVTNEPRVPSPGTPSTSGAATPSKCKKALFNSQEKPK